ncbi:MAG TPA: hypothetical protein PKE55_07600 [Kiritimatiellia bacterium]|nr:hypothetical protein [Kiritimatiellia bacterium]
MPTTPRPSFLLLPALLLNLTFSLLLPLSASADLAPCLGEHLRVSALIQLEDGIRVGIVDASSADSAILAVGETFAGLTLLSADYQAERVILQRGEHTCELSLADDPNAIILPPAYTTHPELYRGEAIERFLREFPNAEADGLIKFPLQPPLEPITGRGPGIEALLQQHPEFADLADLVVTGRGPGIERFLSENPDLAPPTEIPEGRLGPGIEEALRNHPHIETNLFMQLLDEHGLTLPETPTP